MDKNEVLKRLEENNLKIASLTKRAIAMTIPPHMEHPLLAFLLK